MKVWGRLLRLSLAPSAMADVAAGAVFAQGFFPFARRELYLMIAASLCVYHGGMALNDWADRAADARSRPDRPIPSGKVSANAALSIGILLLAAGPLLASSLDARAGWTLAAVAALAAVYDIAGRGAWLGPLLLGACRAGNLFAGIFLGLRFGSATYDGQVELHAAHLVAPALYAAYVFSVSRLGRLEDTEEPLGRAPRVWALASTAVLALSVCLPAAHRLAAGPSDDVSPRLWRALAVALVACALIGPFRFALRTTEWTPPLVVRAMGMLLRRLLIFTAVVALTAGSSDGIAVASVILCGYPLSFALRKVFPPS